MKNLQKKWQQLRQRLFFIVPVISILLLVALAYNFKGLFWVAMVNNQPISRLALDRELEKQGGRQALENLIMETLILQEAKKKEIVVSTSETAQKIKEIEKQFEAQGQNLDSFLISQGQTRKDLEQQIKIQMMVEKMLGDNIKITDQEILSYFEENKSFFPKGTTLESKKEEIGSILTQQKMSEAFQSWSEDLRKEAKISYFVQF